MNPITEVASCPSLADRNRCQDKHFMRSIKLGSTKKLRSLSISSADYVEYQEDPIPDVPSNGARIKVLLPVHAILMNLIPLLLVLLLALKMVHFFSGYEVAGTIESLGEATNPDGDLSVGDRVVIFPHPSVSVSGYSDFIAVYDLNYVIKLPDSLSLDIAAMLPVGALSAYQAILTAKPFIKHLTEAENKPNGVAILIVGSGGLALWTLKIMKYLIESRHYTERVKIIVASTNENGLNKALQEGCNEVVYWNDGEFEQNIIQRTKNACPHGVVDLVVDFVSSHRSVQRSLRCLNDGGILFVGGNSGVDVRIPLRPLAVHGHSIVGVPKGSIEKLKELVALVSEGKIKTPEYHIYPVNDIANVVRKLSMGEITGRAVLKLGEKELNVISA